MLSSLLHASSTSSLSPSCFAWGPVLAWLLKTHTKIYLMHLCISIFWDTRGLNRVRAAHLLLALFQSVVSFANCFLFLRISGKSSWRGKRTDVKHWVFNLSHSCVEFIYSSVEMCNNTVTSVLIVHF